MVYEEMVHFIFNIINLGVFFGAAGYLFKRYLLPNLMADIKREKKYYQDLQDKYKKLEDDLRSIRKGIEDQEHLGLILDHKVKLWKKLFMQQEQVLDAEKDAIQQELRTRKIKQQNFLSQAIMQKTVLPKALQNASEILQKKFLESAEQNQFMDVIQTTLKQMDVS